MTLFYPGIVGPRGANPTDIVIHNDAGSRNATAAFYKAWLPTRDAENGFAHYYAASDGTYMAEDPMNMAWHCANATGNGWYIGIEVCQQLGDLETFLANEQKAFKLAAELCKRFNIPVDVAHFPLHQELSSTSCPSRSLILHGNARQALKEYYVSQVKKYMNGTATTGSTTTTVNPTTPSKGKKINQGIYQVNELKNVNNIWQVRCNFLVPIDFNWTDNGIAVDDIVLVDSQGYILGDQTTKNGSYFVFDTNKIKSVSKPIKGSGGYNWCEVDLKYSGKIWLSVADKNDLINKVSNA